MAFLFAVLANNLKTAQKTLSDEKSTRLRAENSLAEERAARQAAKQSFHQSNDANATLVLELETCDRTTSEMRGSSPKIISGDSRRSKNAQTHTHKHTVPNTKFKLKLLQIKCHVLGFITDKAQNVLPKIIRVFAEAFISHDRHTLFALEESGPPRTT
jgi:hypothetical protein